MMNRRARGAATTVIDDGSGEDSDEDSDGKHGEMGVRSMNSVRRRGGRAPLFVFGFMEEAIGDL